MNADIVLHFATPVSAVGAEVDSIPDFGIGSFLQIVSVFDIHGTLISGPSGTNPSSSITGFVGIIDQSGPNIATAIFSNNAVLNTAIDQVSLVDTPGSAPSAPEPSSAVMLVVGFGIAASRLRRWPGPGRTARRWSI
jgi:hypothetical protein